MVIWRFEDVKAWQAARKLVNLIYGVIKRNPDFAKDYRLINQIQAASASSMSNIAEGFSRKSNKEFRQFLFISEASAAEVQSQLYVALDQKYVTKEDFEIIYQQADEVAKMCSGLIKYLNSTSK